MALQGVVQRWYSCFAATLQDFLQQQVGCSFTQLDPSLDMSIQRKLPLRMELHLAETFWIRLVCAQLANLHISRAERVKGCSALPNLKWIDGHESLFKVSLSMVSSIHPSTEDFWLLVKNLHACAIGPF